MPLQEFRQRRWLEPRPAAGTCYEAVRNYENIRTGAEHDGPVSCDAIHLIETAGAGVLTDRPDRRSPAARDLYDACTVAAAEYLGVPWFTTRAWLVVSLPSDEAWAAGARWYRCDLVVSDEYRGRNPVPTIGSLRNAVPAQGCLLLGSFVDAAYIEYTSCDLAHQGETAGAFWARGLDQSDRDAFLDEATRRCLPIVTEFLALTPDMRREDLTYWVITPHRGDDLVQDVQCIVSAKDHNRFLVGSLKGIGNGPIPFLE